jgi:hypothetical protein
MAKALSDSLLLADCYNFLGLFYMNIDSAAKSINLVLRMFSVAVANLLSSLFVRFTVCAIVISYILRYTNFTTKYISSTLCLLFLQDIKNNLTKYGIIGFFINKSS